jgi:hypothetical protein
MKKIRNHIIIPFGLLSILTALLIPVSLLPACKSSRVQEEPQRLEINSNIEGKGPALFLDFSKGDAHNHPSFVLWAENTDGKFIQTLFISRAVGTSVYDHGDPSSGNWKPGEIRRPATLPYWAHRRNIKASDGLFVPSLENPVPDAYTGATPAGDFGIYTRFDAQPPRQFSILFEINQTWDWNEYWTNNKYPDNEEYKTSCQPALVYMVEVDLDNPKPQYELKPIGHSHYAGETGELFKDLSTITTALDIIEHLTIKFI